MHLTIDTIKDRLQIDRHRLDDELELQPQVTYFISDKVAEANSAVLAAKESLEKLEAEIRLDLRGSTTKRTNDEINAEIQIDADRINKNVRYLECKREHEKLLGLAESWRARGFALKTLADLYMANYFASDSAGRESSYKQDRQTLATSRTTRRRIVD